MQAVQACLENDADGCVPADAEDVEPDHAAGDHTEDGEDDVRENVVLGEGGCHHLLSAAPHLGCHGAQCVHGVGSTTQK